jgi:hypothetical protein
MEDSVLINESAVERGLFTSTYFRTYKEQNNKNHSNGEEEFFTKPEIKGTKPYNYSKLEDDGFVLEDTLIQNGDIIIGKCMPNKNGNQITYKDNSVPFKNSEHGFIDRNCSNDKYFPNTNGDGYTFAKVRIRNDRYPTIGDKLSCYDNQTEILTNKGWIYFKDLTTSIKVACLNEDSLVYEYPTEVFEYNHTGKMYYVKNDQINLLVTYNHRMYVKNKTHYDMEIAEDIVGLKRTYKKNIEIYEPKLINVPKEIIIKNDIIIGYNTCNNIIPIMDWLIIYGTWISEGFEFTEKVMDIKELLMSGYNVIMPCKNSFPDWIWFLNMEQSRLLANNICVIEGSTMIFKASSSKMAGDFQRLCLHAGWTSQIIIKNYLWNVILSIDDFESVVYNSDEWVNYDGKVYCCEVPIGKGVVYVRRNGIPCWSGNSRSGRFGLGRRSNTSA